MIEQTATETVTQDRIQDLRNSMKQRGVDGVLIPRTDEHQAEYVAPYAERLAWLTGFTGSAGFAIVLSEKAAVFVDGRYTIQVRQQIDESIFEVVVLSEEGIAVWLAENAQSSKIAFDPWLHTKAQMDKIRPIVERKEIILAPMDNLIDGIWKDQPGFDFKEIVDFSENYAGRSRENKILTIAEDLRSEGMDAAIITKLDSLAWLANIRGSDVEYSPVSLSYGVVASDGVLHIFCNVPNVSEELKAAAGDCVVFHYYSTFTRYIQGLSHKNVMIDQSSAPYQIWLVLKETGAYMFDQRDVVQISKAIKNSVEIDGMRQSHIRDGAAVSNFLAWTNQTLADGKNTINENDCCKKLLQLRSEQSLFKGESFHPIMGSGPNGAIMHYKHDADNSRELSSDELLLSDSGGQYFDGTTDITRTICFDEPSDEQKDRYTRVLKGHIGLVSAKFPMGTTGTHLDALARHHLWEIGEDYAHGTGHGVGHYLYVHEGPQSISRSSQSIHLMPGMILSNEPGFYKEGEYGIRLENLIVVREEEVNGQETLSFENLTMVPFCRDLIDFEMLSDKDKKWLNDYHAQVFELLEPLVDESTKPWLQYHAQAL